MRIQGTGVSRGPGTGLRKGPRAGVWKEAPGLRRGRGAPHSWGSVPDLDLQPAALDGARLWPFLLQPDGRCLGSSTHAHGKGPGLPAPFIWGSPDRLLGAAMPVSQPHFMDTSTPIARADWSPAGNQGVYRLPSDAPLRPACGCPSGRILSHWFSQPSAGVPGSPWMLCPLGLGAVWGLLVPPGPRHPISRVLPGSRLAQSSTAVLMVLAGAPKLHGFEVPLMLRSVVQFLPFCT